MPDHTFSTKLPFSIIIVTHRADERFERALASCQWAAEVIVVDCGCATEWETLQKKWQFVVKPCPVTLPLADFARLRNGALRYATQPWILFLDSDEVITPESLETIRATTARTDIQGVAVQRIDIFHNQVLRHGETGSLWLTRLVRTGAGRWQRPVHEVLEVEGTVIQAPIVLHHHAHQNVSEFLQKIVRYAQLEAQHRGAGDWQTFVQLLVYPKSKFIWNYVAKRGFLDGMPGLVYALMMSLHSLLVRAFQLELRLKKHETARWLGNQQ